MNRWNFADPSQCKFSVERLEKQGSQIPEAIEEALTNDLFVPEDFEELALEIAANNESVGKLLRELQEPRPAGQDCIPWLGETAIKERLLRLCANGKIALNLRGMEYLQTHPGEDVETSWRRLRPKLSITGRHLDDVFVMLPSAVPATGGIVAPAPLPTGGGIFSGDGATPVAGVTVPPATGYSEPTPVPGGIFGAGSAPSRPRIPLSNPATSPLNLIGKIEGWGIGPATRVAEVSIKVSAATGAQLKELLKKLPEGMTFELNLEKEERLMALNAISLHTLTQGTDADAWGVIIKQAIEICLKPLAAGNAPGEVVKRDREIGELDLFLSSSGWDLWQGFGDSVERTSDRLIRWWAEPFSAKAVLILDGLSLRELPWLLQGAKERGFTLHEVSANASELPGETDEFARALGFASRSKLQNNGGGLAHKLQSASTESVDLPWKDCEGLVDSSPN